MVWMALTALFRQVKHDTERTVCAVCSFFTPQAATQPRNGNRRPLIPCCRAEIIFTARLSLSLALTLAPLPAVLLLSPVILSLLYLLLCSPSCFLLLSSGNPPPMTAFPPAVPSQPWLTVQKVVAESCLLFPVRSPPPKLLRQSPKGRGRVNATGCSQSPNVFISPVWTT